MPGAYQTEQLIELELAVDGNVHILRIDPAFDCCMVKILDMSFNGERVPLEKRKVLQSNGRILKPAGREEGCYQPGIVFPVTDPNIYIDLTLLERRAENTLCARMEIVRLPMDMVQDMAKAVKKIL